MITLFYFFSIYHNKQGKFKILPQMRGCTYTDYKKYAYSQLGVGVPIQMAVLLTPNSNFVRSRVMNKKEFTYATRRRKNVTK